jgi:anthranilate synthase component 1
MAVHYFRFDVTSHLSSERAFTLLIGETDNAFWLDDSLNTAVSYIGVGTPVSTTDGFTEFDAESDSPISRVGWVPYGERASTLGVSVGSEAHPGPVVLSVDCAVEFDHVTGSVTVYSLDEATGSEWAHALADADDSADVSEVSTNDSGALRRAVWRDQPADYRLAIVDCQERIREGDAYQLCLTTSVTVSGAIDAVSAYRQLRRGAPTQYGGFIRSGGVALLSASPELFLSVHGGIASTQPIKGTRRRSDDPIVDEQLKRELLESDKERAENLMIVDLCRNDLSTVCDVGTVNVPSLHVVTTYKTVHQLISTVTGRVAEGRSVADVARALFPAGSMTGAPKLAAVEILSGVESGERGIYSGVFGFSGNRGLTLAMTIRSIVVDRDGATIGVGGGITSSSDPDDEIREVGVKADALLAAIGASPNLFLTTE